MIWSFLLFALIIAGVLYYVRDPAQTIDVDQLNQRELDNYMKAELTPSEIGLKYERYIGYLLESDGYKVIYHGAINGFEDQGRDLIAQKNGTTWIIQAKRWAHFKQIPEKEIFQLYGTLEHYRIKNKEPNAKAKFYTSAKYSEKARAAAAVLGIEVVQRELDRDYPMIKCNVAYKSDEKIYHLPTDDYYDKINIRPDKGAFFAKTVKEATAKGFRRAKKYKKTG